MRTIYKYTHINECIYVEKNGYKMHFCNTLEYIYVVGYLYQYTRYTGYILYTLYT